MLHKICTIQANCRAAAAEAEKEAATAAARLPRSIYWFFPAENWWRSRKLANTRSCLHFDYLNATFNFICVCVRVLCMQHVPIFNDILKFYGNQRRLSWIVILLQEKEADIVKVILSALLTVINLFLKNLISLKVLSLLIIQQSLLVFPLGLQGWQITALTLTFGCFFYCFVTMPKLVLREVWESLAKWMRWSSSGQFEK